MQREMENNTRVQYKQLEVDTGISIPEHLRDEQTGIFEASRQMNVCWFLFTSELEQALSPYIDKIENFLNARRSK